MHKWTLHAESCLLLIPGCVGYRLSLHRRESRRKVQFAFDNIASPGTISTLAESAQGTAQADSY